MHPRRLLIGGNWKMNGDLAGGVELAEAVAAAFEPIRTNVDAVIFPPFPYLQSVARALGHSGIELGAQDCSAKPNGARTGEVSASMLVDLGVQHVIIGHSERRQFHHETDRLVCEKVHVAMENGLKVMLCVGETWEERSAGRAVEVVQKQLRGALEGLQGDRLAALTVAYEPVWAIGTGKSATPKDAAEAHEAIRRDLEHLYDRSSSAAVRILYGGSVNAANAPSLFAHLEIEGALVGGASLKGADFASILGSAATAFKGRRG
ncbi:MAG: triose-phosphate isomerase [Planctomycetes bacterium]|nr:triose-phosphate isomerase [Planctomycetota bacterium]